MTEFNLLTLFPEAFCSFTAYSICARAIALNLISVNTVNFRDYTLDKHRRVDDYPFGGGAGMLIAPQSVFDCFTDLKNKDSEGKSINIYMSPSGVLLDQKTVKRLSGYEKLNILCGHYEGVDQRIIDELIDEEISIGDYVLTGGELPAMVLMDAVMRQIPGVLGNEKSAENESFSDGNLLEHPQYTRPADFRGLKVPEVLLSGHHKHILEWQKQKALEKTAKNRPDLLNRDDK
jgi:tRNA (guanine37-N1)-methyltransferase